MAKEPFDEAARFWEPWRIGYNLALAIVAFVAAGLGTILRMSPADIFGFISLAIAANLLYSVCYPLDFWMQRKVARAHWRRRRLILWVGGTLFAAGITFIVGLAATAPILADDPILSLEPPP